MNPVGEAQYSLDQWNNYREQMAAYVQSLSAEYAEQVEMATAAGAEAPPPPAMPPAPGELPDAFKPELMPELQEHGDYAKALHAIHTEYRETLKWLKELRQAKEATWAKSEDAYNMVKELAYDENRNKSVHLRDYRNTLGELEPERMSLVLPFAYESVQLIWALLYGTMRGVDNQYCELAGQEPNDNPDAVRTENFLNYQFSHEIQTVDVLADFARDACVLGTGVVMQTWDARRNRRCMTVLRRHNVWWDKAPSIQDCNVVTVRMETTVGKLLRMRQDNEVWFDDKDIEAAAARTISNDPPTQFGDTLQPDTPLSTAHQKQGGSIHPNYQKVYLDIMMHTEPMPRWTFVVNEHLVVAVVKPLIYDDPDREIEHRFPISVAAPIRRRGEIDGDSFVARTLDVQDMSNAALELMIKNLEAASIGIGITNDPDMARKEIAVGEWNVGDPTQTTIIHPVVNSTAILSVIDWLMSRVSDRITGTTAEFRGSMQYSGMPATAVRDLLAQSGKRVSPLEDRVRDAMQDVYETAITLNRLYLNPHKFFRIVGEQGLPQRSGMVGDARPISAADIMGCAGKDLVPTGFPGSATDMAQKALNFAAVVTQTGGNPQPLMREAIRAEFRGRVDVSAVYPEDGVGHNPFQENELLIAGRPVRRDPDDGPFDMMHAQIHQTLDVDARWIEAVQANPALEMMRQEHIAAHMAALQQQAALLAGTQNLHSGMGSGQGAAGLNMSMIAPDPKTDAEREAQMGEINERVA